MLSPAGRFVNIFVVLTLLKILPDVGVGAVKKLPDFDPNKPGVLEEKIPPAFGYFVYLLVSFENISPGLDFIKSPNI
jgi:hypothetical protein